MVTDELVNKSHCSLPVWTRVHTSGNFHPSMQLILTECRQQQLIVVVLTEIWILRNQCKGLSVSRQLLIFSWRFIWGGSLLGLSSFGIREKWERSQMGFSSTSACSSRDVLELYQEIYTYTVVVSYGRNMVTLVTVFHPKNLHGADISTRFHYC